MPDVAAAGVQTGRRRLFVPAVVAAAVVVGGGTALAVAGPLGGGGGGGRAVAVPRPTRTVSLPTLPQPRRTAPPEGYRRVHDPTGFSVSVPRGWKRSTQEHGTVVYFRPPGSGSDSAFVKIYVQADGPDADPPTLRADFAATDKALRKSEDYKKIGSADNTVLGLDGIRWEYLSRADGEGPRLHIINEGFVDPAGQLWHVMVGDAAAHRESGANTERFRRVLDGFGLDRYV